jgi:F0F1-type ATP synthase assembly protein I
MDDKAENRLGGNVITGALISGGIGILLSIFMPGPWHSYLGMIIGFFIGGAGASFWLVSRMKRK